MFIEKKLADSSRNVHCLLRARQGAIERLDVGNCGGVGEVGQFPLLEAERAHVCRFLKGAQHLAHVVRIFLFGHVIGQAEELFLSPADAVWDLHVKTDRERGTVVPNFDRDGTQHTVKRGHLGGAAPCRDRGPVALLVLGGRGSGSGNSGGGRWVHKRV